MPQKIIDLDPSKSVEVAVKDLQLPARPLIILLGDPQVDLHAQIRSMFSRVVAPACIESGASVLDNAKGSGCAALLAQAALDHDRPLPLVGVIEQDRPGNEIDPSHELVFRLPAIWSGQAKYLCQIASELAPGESTGKRITALLLGGTVAEKKALICCTRRGWPILVIGKTGGIADEIVAARTAIGDATQPLPADPDLLELMETATIYLFALDGKMDDLNRIVMGRIGTTPESSAETLKDAWRRYDEIDKTAMVKQRRFRRLELALISLAVLAAFFSILEAANPFPGSFKASLHSWYLPHGTLHIMVLLAPITLSILAAYNSHFRDGSKWILLRGAAEELKREIFKYRAQAGGYSDEQCVNISRELKLAGKIKDITSSLEQSEINRTNLESTAEREDPRNNPLSPDQYVAARIQDQTGYFRDKTRRLAAQLRAMQVLIYIVGGAGTFLAAIRRDIWVALATAIVTALTTKLQSDQVETSLVQYNQALASLRNIEAWWKALTPWEKGRRSNIDLLVDRTEKTLESETAGWVQQMQSALDKLTEKEPQVRSN